MFKTSTRWTLDLWRTRMRRYIRSQAWLARWLFHIKIPSRAHNVLWDSTTSVLRDSIRRYLRHGYKCLDLGTGHLGILAIYAASLCRVQVEAVDINEKFIHNATLVARANGIRSGRFYTSDWFSNVTDRFDLIWANVPYVPTQSGLSRGNLPGYTYIWDGGDDGCLHARHILSNVEGFLSAEGRLLLGMNTFYVPRHHTVALISAVSGLAFENIITARHSHSEVYVIRLANPGGSL